MGLLPWPVSVLLYSSTTTTLAHKANTLARKGTTLLQYYYYLGPKGYYLGPLGLLPWPVRVLLYSSTTITLARKVTTGLARKPYGSLTGFRMGRGLRSSSNHYSFVSFGFFAKSVNQKVKQPNFNLSELRNFLSVFPLKFQIFFNNFRKLSMSLINNKNCSKKDCAQNKIQLNLKFA